MSARLTRFRAARIRAGIIGAREPWRWPLFTWHPLTRKAFDHEFRKPWWRHKTRHRPNPKETPHE